MNWNFSYVENSRYEMFQPLTDDGDFIYRGNYSTTDETHRNKLNQVDTIDIFLSDTEFLQLKQNTPIGEPLTVQRFVESAYGVPINRTLTFTYYPTTADWDTSTSYRRFRHA